LFNTYYIIYKKYFFDVTIIMKFIFNALKKGEARLRHAQEIRQRALARAALARGGKLRKKKKKKKKKIIDKKLKLFLNYFH